MNSFQRVIKYCAIAFAVFLTIIIISAIASTVFAVFSFIPGRTAHSDKWSNETMDYSKDFNDVKSFEINHKIGELYIKTGDEFKVEGENVPRHFEAEVDNSGKLTINYNSNVFNFPWFHRKGYDRANCRVTLYLPPDFVAEKATLDTGAGNLKIEGLKADDLKISAGAGNIDGSDITAEHVDIDGGVGNINFDQVNFSDTVLESGVGNLSISGILLGDTELDSGVGEVNLDLTGDINDYDFDIDSGIGSVRLNGEKISENHLNNSDASNKISVDGGIGNVRIDINEE